MVENTDFSSLFDSISEKRSLRASELLFDIGDPADEMYVIISGSIHIKINDVIVDTVGAGGIIGEMALLDHAPRSARAEAAEDSEIAAVDERSFLLVITQTPYFAIEVMRTMAHRLRAMNERV